MITLNTEQLVSSVEAYKQDVIKRLTYMVKMFSYNVTLTASGNTPKVYAYDLETDLYRYLYEIREDKYGIPYDQGFHRGAWKFSSSKEIQFDARIVPEGAVGDRFETDFSVNYKLGQVFYIGAKGPGYSALDGGSSQVQAPEGIMRPTIDQVMSIYANDLSKYYKQGPAT
jgi:hypothetical protein